jgi:dTMP kinase
MQGKLVVICGIDGSGKTTLQNNIGSYLETQNQGYIATRQPTNFYRTNEHVRKYLDTGETDLSIEAIALFAACDRLMHIDTVVNPSLENGKWVLCDRYVYSSYAYFKSRGIDEEFTREINKYVPAPDKVIFLELPGNVACERVLLRDGDTRKFEEKSIEYMDDGAEEH